MHLPSDAHLKSVHQDSIHLHPVPSSPIHSFASTSSANTTYLFPLADNPFIFSIRLNKLFISSRARNRSFPSFVGTVHHVSAGWLRPAPVRTASSPAIPSGYRLWSAATYASSTHWLWPTTTTAAIHWLSRWSAATIW